MAHPTLEYIRGLRKSLEEKKAEIVGRDPSTIPGAEHDSKVPQSCKKPDEETKDETMVPNSGLTTEGAGDDSPITHTHDLEADEPALEPEKKPMITADADAKTAEALAAEILEGVSGWYKKQAEAAEAAKTAEEPEALVTDTGTEPEQTKDPIPPKKEPEVTDKADAEPVGEGASGETAAAAEAECKDSSKCAGALDMELTSDVLAKIAAIILSTEEGTKLAEDVLGKAAGADAAAQTIDFLRAQSDLAEKQAAYAAGQRDAELAIRKLAEDQAAAPAEAQGGISVDDIADTLDAMVESGEITEDEADQVVADLAQALVGGGEKEAQAAIDPAAAEAAMNEQVAVPPEQFDPAGVPQGDLSSITPDDIADAIDGMVESGEITEDEADQLVGEIVQAAQSDDQQISPEEVAETIQEMVQSGELPPEAVQEVLGALEGVPAPEQPAKAAPAAAEAAPAAAPAAEAAPAALSPADEPKTAGAALLARIMANRRAR